MFAMLFLKNAAGALRRNLTDTAHHVFSGPHRGWKIALYVTMLVVPGGSLAALGFAWFDHRRQRNAKQTARRASQPAAPEPSTWRSAADPAPVPVHCH
ncbi:multidrug ABC transporter ATPase [Burkholderia diffusa]|uniref:Multidrug ABC transporter ATPase n=2 Tax=Burkholderia diffusa TaxID=488732 RepID=A0AAW3PHC2_9BURK|nr:multidrug ABC transporter ATPase [Burkholderia diffusa]KVC14054.1 multidrug ABC transporter ATPase [Burkholderia diffusa]KVG29983.1 multidrug ABC transporter ATPase [Burkholderia diffusa]KVH52003.1 multidrug ABC transporter ATPase [Burkholderia diffusa]KVN04761.1 multidrug ABC transporter ATPase [Burkholderia diffusa]